MSVEPHPDLGLFLDILRTLERIDAPYMIIGAFAGIQPFSPLGLLLSPGLLQYNEGKHDE
jgi:hypothetical protein